MKARTIFLSALLVSLLSCKEETIVDPGKSPSDPLAVSIAVGNQYNIHYGDLSGIVYVDWYSKRSVLRDTTIGANKYFVYSSGEIIRSTANSVVEWSGSSENTLYRFNVKVGDSISYQGRQLIILAVSADTVFAGTQTVVEASNAASTPDTTVTITFATKFGMLSTRTSIPNKSWTTSLSGAKIDTTKYGVL